MIRGGQRARRECVSVRGGARREGGGLCSGGGVE